MSEVWRIKDGIKQEYTGFITTEDTALELSFASSTTRLKGISKNQLRKQAGNSVTVNIISAIGEKLL